MRNKLCSTFFLLVFVFQIGFLEAQSHVSVPVDDPVYQLIEIGELKGVIPRQSVVKPYSRTRILKLLEVMLDNPLPEDEKEILHATIDRFTRNGSLPETGRIPFGTADGVSNGQIGVSLESNFSVPFSHVAEYDWRNQISAFMEGDLSSSFSYRMKMGFRWDKLDSAAWPAFSYSTPGEAFYLDFTLITGAYSDGEVAIPVTGFNTEPEMALSFLNDNIYLRWGMINRDWGIGEGNFSLSATARRFDALEGFFNLGDWVRLSFLTGTLTDYKSAIGFKVEEMGSDSNTEDPLLTMNMFTTKRVEFFLPWSFYFAIYENNIWPKRFEPGYMNPFMITTVYQNILGDWDNMSLGVDAGWSGISGLKLYGSFVVDEMFNANPLKWFTVPRNIFGLQGGVRYAIPGIPFTQSIVQYTRLEPFFSAHYPQTYPTYYDGSLSEEWILINTSYMNKGENLGYYLPPNSEEFKVKMESAPFPGVELDFTWKMILLGDDDLDGDGYSGMMDYMDYEKFGNGEYAEKPLLTQRLSQYHIVMLDGSYHLKGFPLVLEAGYSFNVASSRPDGSSEWGDVAIYHMASIGFRIYP